MKIINFFVLLLLISMPAVTQTADSIIKKNLFDPQRGQEEPVDEASGPVEEVLPKDIPILDGIVTIGNYQRVIFRYKDGKSHKMVSGVFKKGDKCTTARILQILPDEVTIAFAGKKYKMTVDSKNKMKNVPRTSASHRGGMARTAASRSRASSRVVERKTTAPRRSPAVRTPPRRSGAVARSGGASTPFGSSRGASRTKKRPKSRKKTPF